MSNLEEIEKAVEKLPLEQLAQFRDWFEAFDAARFDERIESDVRSGKLDALAAHAQQEFRASRARKARVTR